MVAKFEEGRRLDPKKMCFVFYFFIQSQIICVSYKSIKKEKKKGIDLILKSVFFYVALCFVFNGNSRWVTKVNGVNHGWVKC